ncbi:MAG: hypothetical protein KDJ65_37960, partial [Anaerolineae bacterium]|nr:hypothetical protein [Anaerolineae bacterium]
SAFLLSFLLLFADHFILFFLFPILSYVYIHRPDGFRSHKKRPDDRMVTSGRAQGLLYTRCHKNIALF